MNMFNESEKTFIKENQVTYSLEKRSENKECHISFDTPFENKQGCNYFDLGNLRFPSDSSVEKMLHIMYSEQDIFSHNPFKFSSIWLLVNRERHYELLTLDEVGVLLPKNGCDLMTSKTYVVNMHFTPSVVDHYSKEINKLLTEENFFINLNCNIVLSQISCLPNGSKVTLFAVSDERYESWSKRKCIERFDPLAESVDLKEVLYEIENIKEMFKQSEENIKNNVLNYIKLKTEDFKCIVDAVHHHMSEINSANSISDKLRNGIINKWLTDAANYIKESKVSVAFLVQCNDLLIVENANINDKYEKLKTKMEYSNSKVQDLTYLFKEDFRSQSTERLRCKLSSLLNRIDDLQIQLFQSQQQNASSTDQILKLKVEIEQQNLKCYHTVGNQDIENALLKKEIAEKDQVIKQAIFSGKSLLENIRSTESIILSMGKNILIPQNDAVDDAEILTEIMITLRHYISEFSRMIVTHNHVETSVQSLRKIKTQYQQTSEDPMKETIGIEVNKLKEKLSSLQNENIKLMNDISNLSAENSSMQVPQSNIINLSLNEKVHGLQKEYDASVKEVMAINDSSFEKSTTSDFGKTYNALKFQLDEVLDEKYKLMGKIKEYEEIIKKLQHELKKKELLHSQTVQNYESYIVSLKKEYDCKEAKLNSKQTILQQILLKFHKNSEVIVEQMESLKGEIFNCGNMMMNNESKVFKEALENLALHLNEDMQEFTGMKDTFQLMNKITDVFSFEEINFEAEIQNIIENEFNESMITELEGCLHEKENLINFLKVQGKSDRQKITQITDSAFKWKKQLNICKTILKEYKDKASEIVRYKGQFYQTLSTTIERNNLKLQNITKECQEKSKEIAILQKELKNSNKNCTKLKDQFNLYSEESEKKLIVANKRLKEYEKHVIILDQELERQVKLAEGKLIKGITEKKVVEDQLLQNVNQVNILNDKLKDKNKIIAELKEISTSYDEKYVGTKKVISQLTQKCNEMELTLLRKKTLIKKFENEKKTTENMLISCNKTESNLIEEQRKTVELEKKVQLLEVENSHLANKIKEKEEISQNSYNELQYLKGELTEIKKSIQENSLEVNILEKKHNNEKSVLEQALNKCLDERKSLENSYNIIFNEKTELLKEHDTLIDKLIHAIHMLMKNKLIEERMGVQIKELNDIVSILKRQKVSIAVTEETEKKHDFSKK